MSQQTQSAICGLLTILIAGYLGFLAFRQNAVVFVDMRRDLTVVEHNVIESAKAARVIDKKELWFRALVFNQESLEMRGARDGESYMQMTRRWIHFLQLPYWPSITLTIIGIFLCFPLSAKTK